MPHSHPKNTKRENLLKDSPFLGGPDPALDRPVHSAGQAGLAELFWLTGFNIYFK